MYGEQEAGKDKQHYIGMDSPEIEGKKDKEMLNIVHKIKIANSDLVYVLWDGEYLGESTRSEIAHAESLRKPLMFVNVETGKYSEFKEKEDD